MKKISIITVNYNNAAGLEKTIASVLEQTFTDYEYLVIDGGSTDESSSVIERHADRIDYWVSEKDRGVYHAMNKGIARATGEYCYFLNSGDYLWRPGSLERMFAAHPTEDIVYGNMIQGGVDRVEHGLPVITFYDFYIGSIYHQSAFMKKALFDRVGLYSEEYKVVSDWEFFLKAIFLHGCTTRYIDVDLALYEIGGLSFRDLDANLRDRRAILQKYFSRFVPDYADYDRFKRSNFSGIYRSLENSRLAGRLLRPLLSLSRFFRFSVLRQKR
jgi:glycosyltransferase involved in cell wall biosynthesis